MSDSDEEFEPKSKSKKGKVSDEEDMFTDEPKLAKSAPPKRK